MRRTGCAGCPYGKNFEEELEIIRKYEPRLYNAVNNIFGKSYRYTRNYRIYATFMKYAEKTRRNSKNGGKPTEQEVKQWE